MSIFYSQKSNIFERMVSSVMVHKHISWRLVNHERNGHCNAYRYEKGNKVVPRMDHDDDDP